MQHLLHPDSITGVPKFKTRAAEIRHFLEQNPQVIHRIPVHVPHCSQTCRQGLCMWLIDVFQVTHFVILDDRADAADAELLPHFIQVHCPLPLKNTVFLRCCLIILCP